MSKVLVMVKNILRISVLVVLKESIFSFICASSVPISHNSLDYIYAYFFSFIYFFYLYIIYILKDFEECSN